MISGTWVSRRRRRAVAVLATSVAALLIGASASTASATTDPGKLSGPFYVPKPNPGAVTQIKSLLAQRKLKDAALITKLVATPTAVWFTKGTPAEVKAGVAETVRNAARWHTVPVLVAYNAPARDCSQYSAGGAASDADYKAWIDGFAAGIGGGRAVVIVEPDGLALLPSDCGQETSQSGPVTQGRFGNIAYAAKKLGALRNTHVYLDAGHSHWQSVGTMTDRLIAGGVADADGFSLNTSNYQTTKGSQQYGSWISKCIAYVQKQGGASANCASQYYPATATDESTWGLTDAWYAANVTATPDRHFTIDTSRNGKGPWTPPADHPAGDAQDWCNPPDRGAGPRPTTKTGNPLNDAFLWVKVPGESDGQCYRWTTGPNDPVRNMADPAAGQWFPEMALELARNATPPLF
jgi:endoglucanase